MANIKFSALPTGTNVFGDQLVGLTSSDVAEVFTRRLLTAVKTADETINDDNTLSDDADLNVELEAGHTYVIFGFLFWESGTTPDFQYAFSAPTGATGLRSAANWTASGNPATAVFSTAQFCSGTAGTRGTPFMATIRNPTNSGTLSVQWSQATSNAGDTTLKINSWIFVMEIE